VVKPQPKPKHGPPAPGTLLYQANWSGGLNGWSLPPGWDTVSGMLVNNGTNGWLGNRAHAPTIKPYTENYAVRANIQVVRLNSACYRPSFGLDLRSDPMGSYDLGVYANTDLTYANAFIKDVSWNGDDCAYGPDTNLSSNSVTLDTSWHTYRVEVKGNDLKLYIDGNIAVETTDNLHLHGNYVGIFSDNAVINVKNLSVTAL
jgi:hypothetical protein